MKPTNFLSPEITKASDKKWDAFCQAAADAGLSSTDDPEIVAAAKQVFYFSDFVSKSCIRDPEMITDLIKGGNLQRRLIPDTYESTLEALLSDVEDEKQLSVLLRRFRRREMVRIAWRDITGWADLSETMGDLSDLADTCLDKAVSILYEWLCAEYGVPVGKDGLRQNLIVLAMGKLGGRELNFSSDIDLIFVYPQNGATQGKTTSISNQEFFERLCRRLIKVMSAATPEGIVFRVDLDLRPYGKSGPLIMNFDAMESYYQEQGREWERYAWIKARAVTGDRAAGDRLLKRLNPFIYRRYLDFGAFESLRDMKQKISTEVKRKKMAGNIKLGPGGIREIEFFGQIFQLIRGGVLPELQERSIQKTLKVLVAENFIQDSVCTELTDAYVFLRNTEHRLQEFSDQQTHELPSDPAEIMRLAASMGFSDPESFIHCLEGHRKRVHRHFSELLDAKDTVRPEDHADPTEADLRAVWNNPVKDDKNRRVLKKIGFDDADEAIRFLVHLRSDPTTLSLSREGRNRLDRLMPLMLKAISRSKQPLPVLVRLLELIKAIQQRTNYLALLLEEPMVISHLVKLANASPWIASYLSRHPVLLDELLDSRSLYRPPEQSELVQEVDKRLDSIDSSNLEHQIEELCIFKQVNTLRVVAADVGGALTLMRTSDYLTYIAETVLGKVLDLSWHHLVEKHGIPTCELDGRRIDRGFAVVAYGKLGGLELGYGSDLDLIFLHAATPGRTRGGKTPVDNTHFFSRLGQRVVHVLSAHTAAGVLYEPDMRLRPSGGSGPLVSHVEGFEEYQMDKAWTWEHQAIVRARPVSGNIQVKKRFEQIRKAVLSRPRNKAKLQKEIVEMRQRMRKELLTPKPGIFDLKQDTGGIVDIEFLVQYLVLLNSHKYIELVKWTDNVRILETLIETGILEDDRAVVLKEAYLTFRAAVHRLNLQEKPSKVPGNQFADLRKRIEKIWADIMGR